VLIGGIVVSWLFLTIAIVMEVCGTTCMKLSDGFSKLTPSVLIWVFYGISFVAFVFALKRIDVSFAYAIWAGLGVLLISAVGILWFREPAGILRLASIGLIMIGVVGLNLTGTNH
jgi:small multidrug resistance pump